ncbi:MAG: hypothetical protein K0U47_06795 [Epsilonproteobacteria bacterium]|nr:hypothetical protein [Campylobacterota bacterium]
MSDSKCEIHKNHDHEHKEGCGHTKIKHGDHVDYLHDGHMHHKHDDHYDEHTLEVNETNPDHCQPVSCEEGHVHGPDCGHEAVPHGDHVCYIVDGRLHYPHEGHCDDHGPVEVEENPKV